MKVAVLGTGDVARSLAKGFLETGHEVKIGTRKPEDPKIQEWVRSAGMRASVGSLAEAAEFGEVVVLAILGKGVLEAIQQAGPSHFRGKLVIDPTNPLEFSSSGPPSLFVGHTDSLGERVQRALPEASVVKVFNTVGNLHFFRPRFEDGPPTMFFCGNDDGAKQRVATLLEDFGWSSIDLGGIEGARLLEPLCVLWVASAMRLGSWNIAVKMLQAGGAPAGPSAPAPADR